MNSLIILPTECVDPTTGILTGERAAYAYDTHGVREGQQIKIGVLGLGKGIGLIKSARRERVEITITSESYSSNRYPIDLVVGISRPQTVKKVIQATVILGARSLHFVRSEHGEKSYLQSTALSEEQMEQEVIKGLEQVWEFLPPTISIHRNFRYFMEHHLPLLGGPNDESDNTTLRLVAHPGGCELSSLIGQSSSPVVYGSIVMCIGPERGWSASEVQEFIRGGFAHVGLGPRVMRVELATVFLFGQLHALRLTG